MSLYSRNPEIKLSAGFILAFHASYIKETHLFKALLLTIDLYWYILQVQILKLVFEIEHFRY